MMHAYDEIYLDDAMDNMGEMLDYVVTQCKIDLEEFWDMFLASDYARQFEKGVPKIVAGTSGTELALNVLGKYYVDMEFPKAQVEYECSATYWSGWILAYYQWYTNRSFSNIRKYISMEEIEALYPTLHEASEQKFVDVVNHRIERKKHPSNLQMLTRMSGYSQRILAEKSGVNLRTLQQYELRAKDINKASVGSLIAMAKVIGCDIEDLLEYDTWETEKDMGEI